nr:putative reverse transcriptase domain, viral movement protein [Tanacetum cinerariifolium]
MAQYKKIKKWKFIRKKNQRGKTSDRCFICQKKCHFARNCPDKKRSQALIHALNQVEPVDVSDLESLYSLDDEPSDSVLCTIAYSDLSFDDDSDTDSPESDSDFGVHMNNPIPHVLPIQEDPPLPLAKIHLLTDAYAKPIPVIAFFDTELLSKFYSLVTKYEIMLSEKKMEVGNPPQRTSRQTEAVKAIKSLGEKMPPLKIPASSEKRILQTDANDECWGAILLVQDNNNKRHVCGYKSGTFKASEKQYRSMFKEIPAVKRGIEKFQFHLIGHEFQVEMDMSFFPQNVLADFLSRPKAYKLEENYLKDASRVQNHTPHFLSMVFSVASHKEEGSSSNTTPTVPVFDLPEEIVETIGDLTFEKRAKLCYKTFLIILLKNHGLCIKGLRFHPDYPFLNIFHILDLWRWLTTTRNGTYVLVMFRRPGSSLPPKAVNDDGSVVYHAPYCFIHDWYKVNPSNRSEDHLDAYKWIEASGQWLYDNFDHCEVETSDDDDDVRSLWSSDDPTHPDAR